MSILQSVKPFWPLLVTFLLPRALGYYQALKVSVRTRPPPRPVPPKASRSLNILFLATCIFLWMSCAPTSDGPIANVFSTTKTRLQVPTEVLFSRLASLRPNGLTSQDEALKTKLTSLATRQIYLRYGPSTLLGCPFCHPDDPLTYTLHHLPTTILLPHLFNLLTLGLSTSRALVGPLPSTLRSKALFTAIALLSIDIAMTTTYTPQIDTSTPSPPSPYVLASTIRPLALTIFDILLAFTIYVSATNRFLFLPFLASSAAAAVDPHDQLQTSGKLLSDLNLALQMAQMKLRGLNVTRSAVVRDPLLRGVEGAYWDEVTRVESSRGDGVDDLDDGVFEDEEVQAAMARVFGAGNVDVARMRRDAEGFVREVTRSLD